MENQADQKEMVTIEATINAPIDKVWQYFVTPEDIMKWNNASMDWHTTSAVNDLTVGGAFSYRMEAKDESTGFDFGGTYDEIISKRKIAYTIGDGRKVTVWFDEGKDGGTHVMEKFEAENQNSIEMQRGGWQAILDNLKKYAERKES